MSDVRISAVDAAAAHYDTGAFFDLLARRIAISSTSHEPEQALVACERGLADLQVIIADAAQHLPPGGFLAVEHGYDQGEDVRTMMHDAALQDVTAHNDLAGHHRVTAARNT